MNTAKADALTAREHLAVRGWIAPRNESFRHLPPPPARAWLGDSAQANPAGRQTPTHEPASSGQP